jgi:hypothetical protein
LPNDRPRASGLEAEVLEVVEQLERRVAAEQAVAVAISAGSPFLSSS